MALDERTSMHHRTKLAALVALVVAAGLPASAAAATSDLWRAYNQTLSKARYIDLTHTITPNMPVWSGFGPALFQPAVNPADGLPYTYADDGFEATAYTIATDQFGTQFDPPAHWAPEQAAIDEVPASYAVRPLVVINDAPAVRKNPKDFLTAAEVKAWEKRHGRIPAGSVVMVRTDWSQRWTDDPEGAKYLAASTDFPSVGLDALKYLHRRRHILFHGHEPLDTDSTPTLEGEHWLMHHGYAQAEGVDHLQGVPATGCLVSFGSPKFAGGLGGYARYVAICPPDSTGVGVKIKRGDAPLPQFEDDLHWDAQLGYRVR
jgi:kynurenine formamidase